MTYLDSDEELESYLSQLPSNVKPKVQRYKGLGEMDYDQLADTTMDAQNRRLLRVDPADAEEAEAVIDMLMGGDVPPRRKFIEDNAVFVENLDI
jgi:DNA gyrase subunit B